MKPRFIRGWKGLVRVKGRCTWCGVAVLPPKTRWCGPACVHEYRLRSSSGYVRQCLLKRDKAVCFECGLDCGAVQRAMKALQKADLGFGRKVCGLLGDRRTYWDACHIVAVQDGGGQCGLDNFVTKCKWCHAAETAVSRRKR